MIKNKVKLEMTACSQNERFARLAAAGFIVDLNPTLVEMEDVKTAVSEAVTNAVIHGYGIGYEDEKNLKGEKEEKKVFMILQKEEREITVIIEDYGKGIEDIEKAMEPMYTSRPEWDRSGMGFAFMEAFMDSLHVESKLGIGTKIIMKKRIWSEDREL